MQDRKRRQSLGRRLIRLSLTWLSIGAVIGVINARGTGTGIELVSMMIGGMIALVIPGILLGVIGGDARGSVIGVAGGLLGYWLATRGGVAMQPPVLGVIMIFSGLLGATGFLFTRFLFWKYRTIFRIICWLVDATPLSAKVSALAYHLHKPQKKCTSICSGA